MSKRLLRWKTFIYPETMEGFMSKVICVTGATSGIGRAVARRFAKEGWRVIGTGRRAERLEELQKELGEVFLPLVFDVSKREQTLAALGNLPEPFAAVDVLVNNAGISLAGTPVQDANLDDLEAMIATNISGMLYCIKAILPGMVRRGLGHIVNIGSYSGGTPNAGPNVYGCTKAFATLLAYDLREDLSGTRIRTTSVDPGIVESEFPLARMKGDVAKAAKNFEGLEAIQPEDMADAIWWAVSCPAHVNISQIKLMPTRQTYGPPKLYREPFPSPV